MKFGRKRERMKQHGKRKGLDKGFELVAKMHEEFGHPVKNTQQN